MDVDGRFQLCGDDSIALVWAELELGHRCGVN